MTLTFVLDGQQLQNLNRKLVIALKQTAFSHDDIYLDFVITPILGSRSVRGSPGYKEVKVLFNVKVKKTDEILGVQFEV